MKTALGTLPCKGFAFVAGVLTLATTPVTARDLSRNEQAIAVAYEHVIKSSGPERIGRFFCLTTGGVARLVSQERVAAGPSVSETIVSQLRARGYNASSASDCFLEGVRLTTRLGEAPAILISVNVVDSSGAKLSIRSAYWYAYGACGGLDFEVARNGDDYAVIPDSERMGFIC